MTPHLESYSTTEPKPGILSAVLTGYRVSRDGRNICGITYVHMCRNNDICRQRQLNHSEMGEGDYGTQSHAAEPYSCLQVWVKFWEFLVWEQIIFVGQARLCVGDHGWLVQWCLLSKQCGWLLSWVRARVLLFIQTLFVTINKYFLDPY